MYDDNGRTTKATVDIAMGSVGVNDTEGRIRDGIKKRGEIGTMKLPKIKCMRVSVQRGSLSEAESEEKSCVECVLE